MITVTNVKKWLDSKGGNELESAFIYSEYFHNNGFEGNDAYVWVFVKAHKSYKGLENHERSPHE